MSKVCVLASLNVDYTVTMDQMPLVGETIFGKSFNTNFGGKGANQAVCLSRLGTDVSIIGKIGHDTNGEIYKKHLEQEKIDITFLKVVEEAPTGVAFINVNKEGDNNIVIIPGANEYISIEDIQQGKSVIEQATVVMSQFEVPFEATVEAFKMSRERHIFTVFNPAPCKEIPNSVYPYIDLLIPNEIEMQQLTGEAIKSNDAETFIRSARTFIAKGVKYVVVTLGNKGALLVSEDEYTLIPAHKVPVIDTTAAGDSFIGGLVSKLANIEGKITYETIVEGCTFASIVASLSIQKAGSQDSLPTFVEVENNIETGMSDYVT